MKLTVIDKTPIAANTIQIKLEAADGASLLPFEPGAHIEIMFADMRRRYSLTSSPLSLSFYSIDVLRTTTSRGGSTFIHDELQIGDVIDASEPRNAFRLNLDARLSVFIAGGIGLTPFYTMMESLSAIGKQFELHYAAREPKRFLPVPVDIDKVSYYPNLNGHRTLDLEVLLGRLSIEDDLYICGPRPLIEEARIKASALGWPSKRIHFENFGGSPKASDKPIKLELALSNMTIDVQPGTTILDALLENNVWTSYECRRGECASCVAEVLSGEADHRDVCLTSDQRRSLMCPCVSWAHGTELRLNI